MADERPKTWSQLAESDADQNYEIDPDETQPREPAYLADPQQGAEIDPDENDPREPGDAPTVGG